MTLRTITFDPAEWQVVPREPIGAQVDRACEDVGLCDEDCREEEFRQEYRVAYRGMLAAAPEPPAQQPTRDLLAEATEQVEALERENHRMRRCVARLMARLTVWLDDDQFNEADGIMTPEFEPPAQQPMTDEQINMFLEQALASTEGPAQIPFARMIEAHYGIGKGESND